jgi:signal transduction histidine kinase/PAS domain-containing protein/ActR/RegA family two-component response regulator
MPEETDKTLPTTDYNVLNEVPSGVGVFDVTGSVIEMKYINDGFYHMIGARREDRVRFYGAGTINSVHPDDRKGLLDEVIASIRENRMFEYRFRNISGSGKYRWIGIRANHEPLSEKTERFFASYYNVDKYVTRQNDLESDRDELNKILGNVPGGIAVFSYKDGEIRIEYANKGFYDMHHGSREFWQSKSLNPVDRLVPEDQNIFWSEFTKVNEKKQPTGNAEYRITGDDGNPHWIKNQFRFAYTLDNVPYFYASFTNLDELKAAERLRAETRRMYEAAVEDAQLVVWDYDITNHRITMAENEFTEYDYKKFGLKHISENVPQSLIKYIDEAYVDTFLEMYRQIESGAPRASCEVWYKLKPGTEPRCERISYSTVFDKNGRPIKAYGIGQNITQQKMALDDYNRMREQLTGNLMDVVGSFQLNLSKNKYISGYSPYPGVVELLKRKTADSHFTATAETVVNEKIKGRILRDYKCENLVKLFKSGKKQLVIEYPVRTSAGGIMWVHSTMHMLLNPGTGDVEGITYTKDITSQKRTGDIAHKLSSASCDYIGVLDTVGLTFEMPTRNWACDAILEGQKISYDKAREMLSDGYIAPEWRSVFLEATSLETVISELDRKGQHIVAYDFLDQPDSSEILKKQIVFSWLNDEKREIFCIQQDVTEAYQKEQMQIEALEKAKCEADAANDAKSAFLSGMSHDLRTPLNGVLGFTAFALKEQDIQKKQEYLEKIDVSGKLLLDLVNDTLELSRIESGKTVLEPETVLQADLIPAVAAAFRPSAEIKNIHYDTIFEIDGSKPVWCDKLKIQKIAVNLISNAIKYTPDNGIVTISLKIVPTEDKGSAYCFTVTDTGIGMSDDFMKQMYEPFAQEKRSELEKSSGTGLGLSIVKKYVDIMGGSITAESRLHEGTRFTVILPVRTDFTGSDPAAGQKSGNTGSSAYKLDGNHVLLCEDNDMNTEIAVMLLKNRGITAETAKNGKEGVETFAASAAGHFDAVLMDIRMPVMDGYEAARNIRKLDRSDAKTVPIIAMSADAFEENVRAAKEAGMNGYLTKPVIPEKLYDKLHEILSAKNNN